MTNKSINKLTGLVFVIAGIGLIYWGYEMSGSFNSQFSQAFSGSSSNDVIVRYIGGAASLIVGIFVFIKK